MAANRKIIKPQEGFQEDFLSSEADIVIGGGAAGVGKTWCELVEPLRHKDVKNFNAMVFRRTTVQIRNPGGLWDESSEIYPYLGARPNSQHLEWTFPNSGAVVKFSHLEHERNIYDHQGAQYCLIIFDEVTHFTKKMFFYLLSRNRSMCGVKPYIRATCNPDPDSFVAELIDWWIDNEEKLPNGEPNLHYGYPIRERAGVIRYFLVDQEQYVWGDTKEEVISKCPHIFEKEIFEGINHDDLIKSITFIPGNIYDNKELLSKDPSYLANLMAQDDDEKARLLDGNWKKRVDARCIFNYICIGGMFTNLYPSNTTNRYITCDAARFGEDWATIFVWYGWKVVKLIVLTKSDPSEIVNAIEAERERFSIIKGRVVVDQDGVGGGVVKLGRYIGFSGDSPPMVEPGTSIKENYKNLKTQLYYRYADKVNADEVSMPLDNNNVVVDGGYGVKVKHNGKVVDVRDLIKQDHRAIRRKENNEEGKKQINSKVEQKVILMGRSPDFSDGASLRAIFDFIGGDIVVGRGSGSILDRI